MLWNGCPQVTRVSQLWSYLSSLKSWKGAFGKHRLGKHRSCKDSNFFWLHRVVAKKDAAKNLSNCKELVGVIHKLFFAKILTPKIPRAFVMFYLRRNKTKKKKEFSGNRRRDFSLLTSVFQFRNLHTSDFRLPIVISRLWLSSQKLA